MPDQRGGELESLAAVLRRRHGSAAHLQQLADDRPEFLLLLLVQPAELDRAQPAARSLLRQEHIDHADHAAVPQAAKLIQDLPFELVGAIKAEDDDLDRSDSHASSPRMDHHVNHDGDGQNQRIVLAGGDSDAIRVARAARRSAW